MAATIDFNESLSSSHVNMLARSFVKNLTNASHVGETFIYWFWFWGSFSMVFAFKICHFKYCILRFNMIEKHFQTIFRRFCLTKRFLPTGISIYATLTYHCHIALNLTMDFENVQRTWKIIDFWCNFLNISTKQKTFTTMVRNFSKLLTTKALQFYCIIKFAVLDHRWKIAANFDKFIFSQLFE